VEKTMYNYYYEIVHEVHNKNTHKRENADNNAKMAWQNMEFTW